MGHACTGCSYFTADLFTDLTGIHHHAMHYLLSSSSHVQRHAVAPAGVFLYYTSGVAVGDVVSSLLTSGIFGSCRLLRALVIDQLDFQGAGGSQHPCANKLASSITPCLSSRKV